MASETSDRPTAFTERPQRQALCWRAATLTDVPLLARLNKELTEDERHRNSAQSEAWFAERMAALLSGQYEAVLFALDAGVWTTVAYALYCPVAERENTVYLRQLYVLRSHRRRGIGREALRLLRAEVWPPGARVVVKALAHNAAARAFYEALGFAEAYVGYELGQTQAGATDLVERQTSS